MMRIPSMILPAMILLPVFVSNQRLASRRKARVSASLAQRGSLSVSRRRARVARAGEGWPSWCWVMARRARSDGWGPAALGELILSDRVKVTRAEHAESCLGDQ